MIEESYLKYIEDLRQAEKEVMLRDWTFEVKLLTAEVERLTATVETQQTTINLLKMIADKAEAREKALRAITGEMLDLHSDGIVTWVRVCNEWDRRAAGIV